MSGEIVRRSASDRPLTRAAAKKLGQIQDAAMLQRAEIDQQENTAAYHAAKRIENAYVLGHHLVSSAVELNREVTAGTAGNRHHLSRTVTQTGPQPTQMLRKAAPLLARPPVGCTATDLAKLLCGPPWTISGVRREVLEVRQVVLHSRRCRLRLHSGDLLRHRAAAAISTGGSNPCHGDRHGNLQDHETLRR